MKAWARNLKRDIVALWLAARHPRTPLAPKIGAGAVAAYALSPIDLIPDFIPVLGLLDDLLIVPLGIWLVLRLLPDDILQQCREEATRLGERPQSLAGALVVGAVWLLGLAVLTLWMAR